jgi:hypothetical protein
MLVAKQSFANNGLSWLCGTQVGTRRDGDEIRTCVFSALKAIAQDFGS